MVLMTIHSLMKMATRITLPDVIYFTEIKNMTKEKFLENVNDWENHRHLLWLALEQTKTGEVVEMGCGDGSTPQLHEYCKDTKRMLWSYDTEPDWIFRFIHMEHKGHKFGRIINNWHTVKEQHPNPSVILVDHAPGGQRITDIKAYADFNGIMVIHDTQPPPTAADYGYERIWKYWKYIVDLQVDINHESPTKDNRTWASAVSNTFDVRQWAGMETGRNDYRICARS